MFRRMLMRGVLPTFKPCPALACIELLKRCELPIHNKKVLEARCLTILLCSLLVTGSKDRGTAWYWPRSEPGKDMRW